MQVRKRNRSTENPRRKSKNQPGKLCQTKDVVYAITCNRCGRVTYIGETGTTLYQRSINHLSSIRNNQYGAPVAKRFNEKGHSIEDVRITGIEI